MAKKKITVIKTLNYLVKNQFLAFFVIILAIVGGLYGLVSYFFQSQKEKYENRIASIERGLGGPDLMNLDKLLLKIGDVEPANSKYYNDGDFYASDEEFWKYSLSNPAEITFIKNDEQVPKDLSGPMDYPINIWYGSPIYKLTDLSWNQGLSAYTDTLDVNKSQDVLPDSIVNIYSSLQKIYQPTISLSRIERSKFSLKMRNKRSWIIEDSVNFDLMNNDELLGRMLHMNLSLVLDNWPDSNVERQLISVQKKDNLVYYRSLEIMKNITINDIHYKEFYVWKENLLICTKDFFYDVKIEIPYTEPLRKGQSFAQVAEWFNSFAVIDK